MKNLKSSLLGACVATTVYLSSAASAFGVTINFTAIIDGASENPPRASLAKGVGVFQLDTDNNQFSYAILFTDVLLTAPETAAHIHGPAGPGVNAPVLIPLPLGNLKTGSVDLDTIATANVADLIGGQWYVNIHTSTFPGGEIRGQIIPVGIPDGSSSLLLLSIALPLVGLGRAVVSRK